MIYVTVKPSILMTILVTMLIAGLYMLSFTTPKISYYLNTTIFIVAMLWIMATFLTPNKNLQIDTTTNQLYLISQFKSTKVQIINFFNFKFGVTLLILKANYSLIVLPIFIDSIPIVQYKQIRTYLRWHN